MNIFCKKNEMLSEIIGLSICYLIYLKFYINHDLCLFFKITKIKILTIVFSDQLKFIFLCLSFSSGHSLRLQRNLAIGLFLILRAHLLLFNSFNQLADAALAVSGFLSFSRIWPCLTLLLDFLQEC